MSASGKTQHYNLPYFTPDDLTTWGAFNNSMLMLDNILYSLSQSSGETPELDEIEEEIRNINDTITALQTNVNNINDNLKELQNNLTVIQNSINKNTEDITKNKENIAANANDIVIIQTNFNTLNEQVQTHGSSIYQLEKNIENLETNYTTINNKLVNIAKTNLFDVDISKTYVYHGGTSSPVSIIANNLKRKVYYDQEGNEFFNSINLIGNLILSLGTMSITVDESISVAFDINNFTIDTDSSQLGFICWNQDKYSTTSLSNMNTIFKISGNRLGSQSIKTTMSFTPRYCTIYF